MSIENKSGGETPIEQKTDYNVDWESQDGDKLLDQVALEDSLENNGLQDSTCLQLPNPDVSDTIYSLAPEEGQKPQPLHTDETFEVLANPDKYPRG